MKTHKIPLASLVPHGKVSLTMDNGALRIGGGYIHLNTGGMDNRRMMSIIGGETKPNLHKFDHRVPLDAYFDLSVIYGRKAMQLVVNGEERYRQCPDGGRIANQLRAFTRCRGDCGSILGKKITTRARPLMVIWIWNGTLKKMQAC